MTNPVQNGPALRCGVVGAGVFGGFHAGKYAAHERAQLVGIYDHNPERAADLAAKFPGARGFETLEALLEACDAVTIASPASAHAEQARAALAASRHLLVEKPLATSAEDARTLVGMAETAGVQLHAGHQERFVARAAGLMDARAPGRIRALRYGPPSERGADVSVVMDLMIHDLDLALRLIGDEPEAVRARGSADAIEANIAFAGGAQASFAASRTAPAPERRTRFEWESGAAEIDWVAKRLDDSSGHGLNPDFAERPEAKDSLGANVSAFLASVLDGAPAACAGWEAARAVALAERIERAAGIGR